MAPLTTFLNFPSQLQQQVQLRVVIFGVGHCTTYSGQDSSGHALAADARHDGIVAPCVFDGPINGICFRAWVAQQLLDTLCPGDIVVMDNLGSHKSIEIGRAIRARGARLWYLLPYSPDLNPIEQAFSKIKHWMRMAQKRHVEDTCRQLGKLVQSIPPNECAKYIKNAGYVST